MINETQAEIDKLRAEFEKPTREAGPTSRNANRAQRLLVLMSKLRYEWEQITTVIDVGIWSN